MAEFVAGETVLCYHGPLIYQAKCLATKTAEENNFLYLIHYVGWSKRWDEWMPGSRIYKYNDVNLQKAKDLFNAHNKRRHETKVLNISEGDDKPANNLKKRKLLEYDIMDENHDSVDINDEIINDNEKYAEDVKMHNIERNSDDSDNITKIAEKHNEMMIKTEKTKDGIDIIVENIIDGNENENITKSKEKVLNHNKTMSNSNEHSFEDNELITIRDLLDNNKSIPKPNKTLINAENTDKLTNISNSETMSTVNKHNEIDENKKIENSKIPNHNEACQKQTFEENKQNSEGGLSNNNENVTEPHDRFIHTYEDNTDKNTNSDNSEKTITGNNETDEENNELVENESNEDYLCSFCTKKFNTQCDLDEHWLKHVLQLEHMQSCCVNLDRVKILKCDSCPRCFLEKSKLKMHTKKHFLERKNREQTIKNMLKIKQVSNKVKNKHITIISKKSNKENKSDKKKVLAMAESKTSNHGTKMGDSEIITIEENEQSKIIENKRDTTEKHVSHKRNNTYLTNGLDGNDNNNYNKAKRFKKSELENNNIDEIIELDCNKNNEEGELSNEKENEQRDSESNETNDLNKNKRDDNTMDINKTHNVNEKELNEISEIQMKNQSKDNVERAYKVECGDPNVTFNKNGHSVRAGSECNIINENGIIGINHDKETNESNNVIDVNQIIKTEEIETKSELIIGNENEIHQIEITIDMNAPEKKYSCGLCTKKFLTKVELDYHWNVHMPILKHMESCSVQLNRSKIFKCEFCHTCFLYLNKLTAHLRKHFQINPLKTRKDDENKPYKCEDCGWGFMKRSTLEAHSVLHQPFAHICECGIGYYLKCDLDAHRRLVHPNSAPPKQITPRQDATPKPKSNPNQNTNKGPKLRPTLTSKPNIKIKPRKTGYKKKILQTHLKKDEHGNYSCTICTNTYTSIDGLWKHLCGDHAHKNDDGTYECNICSKTVKYAALKVHIFGHLKPYTCHVCNKSYTQKGALNLHLLRHTGNKSFACDICGKAFYNDSNLRLHTRTHTGEKPYECWQCGKGFSDPSAFKRHLNIHTGLKQHKCEMCGKAFCDPSALYRHTRMHKGYEVPCTECDKSFKSLQSMRDHYKTIHTIMTDKDKFECDHCCRQFTRKLYLMSHMIRTHLKPNPDDARDCEICGKKFPNKWAVKSHVMHTHLKLTHLRHTCGICGARFIYEHALKRHKMKLHGPKLKNKKFECDYCHKCFFDKSLLGNHIILSHLGIKCEICGRSFSTSVFLKNHKIEGCRRCTFCGTAFPTPSQLEHHLITKHMPKRDQPRHECEYCGKEFPLLMQLQKHTKTHTQPADAFKCHHCSKTFSYRQAIVTHIFTKHMVSLYCDVCFKRFYRESEFTEHKRRADCTSRYTQCDICDKKVLDMKGHLLTHGPRRVQCDICHAKFTNRGTLIRHNRLVHKFY